MFRAKQIKAALLGIVSAIFGTLLHLFATNIAWPKEYSFSGERGNTAWAIKEAAYQNIGMIFLIFGLTIILITIINWLWTSSPLEED